MSDFPHRQQFLIANQSRLREFAVQLAEWLQAGDIVALEGTLGAGKTTLSRALGEAFGLSDSVTSPTFTLLHEYSGASFPVLHSDLYRLGNEGGADAFAHELLESVAAQNALLLVEWACYSPVLMVQATVFIHLSCDLPESVDFSDSNQEEGRLISIAAYRPITMDWSGADLR